MLAFCEKDLRWIISSWIDGAWILQIFFVPRADGNRWQEILGSNGSGSESLDCIANFVALATQECENERLYQLV